MILRKLLKFNKAALVIILILNLSSYLHTQITYPVIAHSHNDYEQNNPIQTALQHGFKSLEVDIVSDGIRLVVSHDLDDLENKPEFEKFYLAPLITQLPELENTILIIDIKEYSDELLSQLNNILKNYEAHLVKRTDSLPTGNHLQIILSGDIPRKKIIENTDNIFLFIDGRLEPLETNPKQRFTPLISINFDDITKWNGQHRPAKKTIKKLDTIIRTIHTSDKKIRFWNTDEHILLWSTLIGLKVDFIGVDNIEYFYEQMHKIHLTSSKN